MGGERDYVIIVSNTKGRKVKHGIEQLFSSESHCCPEVELKFALYLYF